MENMVFSLVLLNYPEPLKIRSGVVVTANKPDGTKYEESVILFIRAEDNELEQQSLENIMDAAKGSIADVLNEEAKIIQFRGVITDTTKKEYSTLINIKLSNY